MTDDDEDEYRPKVVSGDEFEVAWAIGAARAAISRAMTASRVLMGLAVAAAVLGVIEAISSAVGTSDFVGRSAGFSISQVAGVLLTSTLPIGLLGAASAFLRLQASKFEADLPD